MAIPPPEELRTGYVAEKDERPEYKRGVSIVVYSMQGGPIPTKAIMALKKAANEVAQSYHGLAITVVVE